MLKVLYSLHWQDNLILCTKILPESFSDKTLDSKIKEGIVIHHVHDYIMKIKHRK